MVSTPSQTTWAENVWTELRAVPYVGYSKRKTSLEQSSKIPRIRHCSKPNRRQGKLRENHNTIGRDRTLPTEEVTKNPSFVRNRDPRWLIVRKKIKISQSPNRIHSSWEASWGWRRPPKVWVTPKGHTQNLDWVLEGGISDSRVFWSEQVVVAVTSLHRCNYIFLRVPTPLWWLQFRRLTGCHHG